MPRTIFFVAVLSIAFAAIPATACGPGGCPIGGCSNSDDAGVVGVQGDYYFTALLNAKKLDLSEAQVVQIRERYQTQRTQEEAIRHRLDEARQRLQGVITSPTASEAQVETIIAQMRNLKAELRASVVKSAAEGEKLLTETQRDRLWRLVSDEPVAAAAPEGKASPES